MLKERLRESRSGYRGDAAHGMTWTIDLVEVSRSGLVSFELRWSFVTAQGVKGTHEPRVYGSLAMAREKAGNLAAVVGGHAGYDWRNGCALDIRGERIE